jgi:cytochrome oxidase Cu insertion factor (SCO1/SenC/PrrC family)
MRSRLQLTLLFIFSVVTVPVFAQLGPKDGANLPATDLERVKVGQAAPDFTLEDMTGRRISLSDFRGNKNVVLVFYRGHW